MDGSDFCPNCGGTIIQPKRGRRRIFCSRECAEGSRRTPCEVCGEPARGDVCRRCFVECKSERNSEIFELWRKGATRDEIAEAFDMRPSSVGSLIDYWRSKGEDLPVRHDKRDPEDFRALREKGLSNIEIGERLGMTPDNVSSTISALRRKGFQIPYSPQGKS